MTKLYELIWGPYSSTMRIRVEGKSNHKMISKEKDTIKLLENVKSTAYNFKSQKELSHALHKATRSFYLQQQSPRHTLPEFLQQFENLDAVTTTCGGSIGEFRRIAKEIAQESGVDYDTESPADQAALVTVANERYMATALILMADRAKYGRSVEDLENKLREYTRNIPEAYDMLQYFKHDARNVPHYIGGGKGANFHQDAKEYENAHTQNGDTTCNRYWNWKTVNVARKDTMLAMTNVKKKKKRKKNSMFKTVTRSHKTPVKGAETYTSPKVHSQINLKIKCVSSIWMRKRLTSKIF